MASLTPQDRAAILARLETAGGLTDPWAVAYEQDIAVLLAHIEFLSKKRDQAYDCSVRDNKARGGAEKRLKEAKRLFREIEVRFKGV